jgi:glycosyltransferase involved in cell wall biosynthesis
MSSKKKVIITFLGNINYDTRCKNLFDTFSANSFDVEFIGFDWMTKGFTEERENISIFKLRKGFFSLPFYLKFIWHIKLKLFTTEASIIFAEDIYTLPFVMIFGKLKRAKIYYDSRELFGHLAGLKDKKLKQSFWKWIENICIKKVDYVMVTGQLDGEFLKKEYGINNLILLRNLPRYYKPGTNFNLQSYLQIKPEKKIILYQGVLLKGRGIEKVFSVMKEFPDHVFVIAGGGEYESYYQNLAEQMNLTDQVFFIGKLTQEDLPKVTSSSDIGVSLIENISTSYYYALPNKLFEYIMAEVPVIVSDLPQMKEIVEKYDVGFAIDIENKDELVNAIKKLSNDKQFYESKKHNCQIASQELNWEKEVTNLLQTLAS